MEPNNRKQAKQYYWYILRDESTLYDAMKRGDYATAMVAAQQSTEKSMKGILQAQGDLSKAPRTTHNLWDLYRKCYRYGFELDGICKADLRYLTDAYFKGRYPERNQKHPKVYTYEDAKLAGEISQSMWCCFKWVLNDIEEEENTEFDIDGGPSITVYDDRWDDSDLDDSDEDWRRSDDEE